MALSSEQQRWAERLFNATTLPGLASEILAFHRVLVDGGMSEVQAFKLTRQMHYCVCECLQTAVENDDDVAGEEIVGTLEDADDEEDAEEDKPEPKAKETHEDPA